MTHDDHAAALRSAGLRVTAPRMAVLDAVSEHDHANAETIAAVVRERLGSVSRQAVYDVLNALSDAELVRRVSDGGRRSLYELPRHDNHHHAVCRRCGHIEDVPCTVGEAPCLHARTEGFAVETADVLFRGLCSSCREADDAQDSGQVDAATA